MSNLATTAREEGNMVATPGRFRSSSSQFKQGLRRTHHDLMIENHFLFYIGFNYVTNIAPILDIRNILAAVT